MIPSLTPRLKEWLWGLLACAMGAAAGFATAHGADLPTGWGAVLAALFAAVADGCRHFYQDAVDTPLVPLPPLPTRVLPEHYLDDYK